MYFTYQVLIGEIKKDWQETDCISVYLLTQVRYDAFTKDAFFPIT